MVAILRIYQGRGTIFAVATRVLAFIRLETFALAANALAMAGTKLVDVFSIWSDTGLVGSSALAGSVAGYVPFSEAFAFTAIADSVVGSGTKFAIVAIAGEVVALAIISRDDLIGIFPWITLAFSTNTVAPVVAQGCSCIVGPASRFQVSVKAQVFGIAFTTAAEKVGSALANATHVSTVAGTLGSVFDVTRISRLFALALAHHGQVHQNSLIDTHRVDLEHLMPLSRILRTLDHLDLGRELYSLSQPQSRAPIGLSQGPVSNTIRKVSHFHVLGRIILHLNRGRNGLILSLDQLDNIGGVSGKRSHRRSLDILLE